MINEKCTKCGGAMVEGCLVDRTDHHVSHLPFWIEGAPEKGWFGGLKVRGKQRLEVTSRRCRKCGFLELFARPDLC